MVVQNFCDGKMSGFENDVAAILNDVMVSLRDPGSAGVRARQQRQCAVPPTSWRP